MELNTLSNLLNVVDFFQIQVLEFNTVVAFIWKLCSKIFLCVRQGSQSFTNIKLIFTTTFEVGTIIMWGKKIRWKEVK